MGNYVQKCTREEALPHVKIIDDSVAQHELFHMRAEDIGIAEFNRRAERVARSLLYASAVELPTRDDSTITAMNATAWGRTLDDVEIIAYLILGAALAYWTPLNERYPSRHICLYGTQRDHETHEPVVGYRRRRLVPKKHLVIVPDIMQASGGSDESTVEDSIKDGARNIQVLSMISAPDGIMRVKQLADRYAHLGVTITQYTVALDPTLDENAYIRPGLGDAGKKLLGYNSI